jgi:hypothetical protein
MSVSWVSAGRTNELLAGEFLGAAMGVVDLHLASECRTSGLLLDLAHREYSVA